MKKCFRELLFFIFGVVFSGILISFQLTKNITFSNGKSEISIINEIQPKEECRCVSKKDGKIHNFCYIDPQNSTSNGIRFDCNHLTHLENLGLVNSKLPSVDLSQSYRNEKDLVFLSACSDNHFHEAKESLSSLRKFYPEQKFILYSLGLNEGNKNFFKNDKNVEVRDFKYSHYPNYVGHWMEYRFKPLIIAEVMLEYSNIWWMDAHIKIGKPEMKKLLFKEISENFKNETGQLKSPIIFFIYSSHSNFAVLNQKLLSYFPTNSMDLLKSKERGSQLGANTFYVARTKFTLEIFKWWILCALDDKCMNPPGAKVGCSFGLNRNDYFANCFRFDQSVLNLLLLNHFTDHKKYFSSIGYIYS